MKHTLNKTSDAIAELTVSLDAADLERYGEVTYTKIGGSVNVSGFRPGHAPRKLVEQQLGDRWQAELTETAIGISYFEAVREEKLETIAPPQVAMQKFVPGQEMEYKATVALYPSVKLPDYKSLKIKSEPIEPTEDELKETLENLRKQRSSVEPKDSAAEKGDKVEVDFEGFVDGKAIERGKSSNHPMVLGEGQFIPGFEENLIGMKASDAKEFEITFPSEYHDKSLAGKKATFKVKLNLVHLVKLPELDDEFAKSVGAYESLVDLSDKIKENLKVQKEMDEKNRVEQELIKFLGENTKLELPQILIEQEAADLRANLEKSLAERSMNLAQYLEALKKTEDDLGKDTEAEARRRLTVSFAMTEVAKAEQIESSEEEVAEQIKKTLEEGELTDEQKAELQSEEGHNRIHNYLISTKTVEKLLSYIKQ